MRLVSLLEFYKMRDLVISFYKPAILQKTALFIAIAIGFAVSAMPVLAARELIMITSRYCPFCMAWERDIGVIYEKSPYADHLPLTRIDIGSDLPADMRISYDLRGTPTFLILENRAEIGRIIGYSDAELFWWQISEYAEIVD